MPNQAEFPFFPLPFSYRGGVFLPFLWKDPVDVPFISPLLSSDLREGGTFHCFPPVLPVGRRFILVSLLFLLPCACLIRIIGKDAFS